MTCAKDAPERADTRGKYVGIAWEIVFKRGFPAGNIPNFYPGLSLRFSSGRGVASMKRVPNPSPAVHPGMLRLRAGQVEILFRKDIDLWRK